MYTNQKNGDRMTLWECPNLDGMGSSEEPHLVIQGAQDTPTSYKKNIPKTANTIYKRPGANLR